MLKKALGLGLALCLFFASSPASLLAAAVSGEFQGHSPEIPSVAPSLPSLDQNFSLNGVPAEVPIANFSVEIGGIRSEREIPIHHLPKEVPISQDDSQAKAASSVKIISLPKAENGKTLSSRFLEKIFSVFPSLRTSKGKSFENSSRDGSLFDGFFEKSIALDADPKDEASIEKALRQKVDAEAERYGISSSELTTVYVTRRLGGQNQADTFYAYFRQRRDITGADGSRISLPVLGSYLAATVKVFRGKVFLVSIQSKLTPGISLGSDFALSDAEVLSRAEKYLSGTPGASIRFLGRAVVKENGVWKAANFYRKKGSGFNIGVDLLTGEILSFPGENSVAFGVSPSVSEGLSESAQRQGGRSPPLEISRGPKWTGQVLGRAELDDHRPDGKILLSPQPLPHLNLTIGDKEYQADENGHFAAEGDAPQTNFKARLSGRLTEVFNEAGEPLEILGSLIFGSNNKLVFNPQGEDPLLVDQVNAYVADARHRAWTSRVLGNDPRLDYKTAIYVNTSQSGNAWYSPESGFIHSDLEGDEFSDTGRIGILFHEMTHKVNDFIHNPPAFLRRAFNSARNAVSSEFDQPVGALPDAALSEGWGDVFAMFILNTPIVGEGFYKKQDPSWIRSGEEDYQYAESDEKHQKSKAWTGFAWRLRKSLIEKLGQEAGVVAAENLIIPVILAYIPDIPSAMAHVLFNAMDKDGHILYEREIRAAAADVGVELPPSPAIAVKGS